MGNATTSVPWQALVTAILVAGCASSPPRFPTSERAPQPQAARDPRVASISPTWFPPPVNKRTDLVEDLFLALAIGDQHRLAQLLSEDVRLQRANQGATSATSSALSNLQSLFSTGAPETQANPTQRDSGLFVSAAVLSVTESPRGRESEVSVLVKGGPQIRGLWKITLDHGMQLKIVKVTLPEKT